METVKNKSARVPFWTGDVKNDQTWSVPTYYRLPPGEGILLEGEVTQSGSFGEGRIWKTTPERGTVVLPSKGPCEGLSSSWGFSLESREL